MMNHIRFLVVFAGLLFWSAVQMGCKRTAVEANKNYPEDELKILEFHLAGIPDKNITIDHQKREITLRMPATLPTSNLKATYKLGPNTEIVNGLADDMIYASSLNKCYEAHQIGLRKTGSGSPDAAFQYRVLAVAEGKLTFKPQAPVTMELRDMMTVTVPAENVYGNSPLVDAFATREGSSEKISLMKNTSPNNCVWFSNGENANEVQVRTSRQLPPGRYKLEMVQADGTVVPVLQPLVVTKGKAVLGYNQWIWGVMPNESFEVAGFNLFKEDISVTIVGKEKTHQPTLSDFSADGTRFQTAIPALAPGNYIVKIQQNGQEIACQKLSVLSTENQPVLLKVSGAFDDCPTFEKLRLERNKRIAVYYNPATSGPVANPVRQNEQLLLSRVGKPAETYSVSIVPYIEAGPEAPAYFTLSDTVPAGQYEVRLQVKNPATGVSSQSEVYERIMEIP